jgi:hypothetical protein
MKKYESLIPIINNALDEFSKYLDPKHKMRLLTELDLQDSKICWDMTTIGWNDIPFPNGESRGVYIICGKKKANEDFLGAYVGKASHQSKIGRRLYVHLHNKERGDKIFPMRDKSGEEFLLEYVITIPMTGMPFFAPALEEFLMDELQKNNIYLINAVGKKMAIE